MSDAGRVKAIGPITKRQAGRRRIVYGPLTIRQFDDLERVSLLGIASLADMMQGTGSRNEESVIRAMGRHQAEGWVERVKDGAGDAWRMTMRGDLILGFAYAHMDRMVFDSNVGDYDEW